MSHIVRQICGVLSEVHAAGIVHRDLKPDNIFLTRRAGVEDFVKLLDFGVAKLLAEADGDVMVKTSAGILLGTPDYMPPEQVMGRPIDHRVDIYSLGVIMYELLSGGIKPVVAANLGELVYCHLSETPTTLSALPQLPAPISAPLEALVMRCLAKEAGQRPATMAAMLQELDAMSA